MERTCACGRVIEPEAVGDPPTQCLTCRPRKRRQRVISERPLVTCQDCGTEFRPAAKSGRPPERCPECQAARKRLTDAAKSQRWKQANRDKHVAYMRQYHQHHKDDPEYRRMRREAKVLYKFGITQDDLDALIAAQDGKCAICGGEPNGPGTRLHIDHCHNSNRIRGLLCGKCNTAIGLLDDVPERAEALAAYLRR